jgi:hypothetical protein
MVKCFNIIENNKFLLKVTREEEKQAAAELKNAKPIHTDNANLKNAKPQQANPRKIESRGVK